MNIDQLEQLAERVKVAFLNEIIDLSNSEVEIVLDYLIQYFEESVERIRSAREN